MLSIFGLEFWGQVGVVSGGVLLEHLSLTSLGAELGSGAETQLLEDPVEVGSGRML